MTHSIIYASIAQAIAVLFAIAGVVQLSGPAFVQRAYERWEMPRKFYRVTGALEIATALFLASPETRIWGVVLGAVITFSAIITLLKSEQYGWSVPGMMLLMAFVPASLAGPFS
ncbi:MAG: DoxX family protein [Rhizomicrobium sp.]